MEIEASTSDILNYLQTQEASAPQDIKRYFCEFSNLYSKKLWHQLTVNLEHFLVQPQSEPYQLSLFENFVIHLESFINKLKFTEIALVCVKQITEISDIIAFLNNIMNVLDLENTKDQCRDVYVFLTMESAYYHMLFGNISKVEESITECESLLKQIDSTQSSIYATFYRVSADYYKASAMFSKYYHTCLLYLSCINLESLTTESKTERAQDLCLSALLSETTYNFSELLSHSIVDSLKNRPHRELYELLVVMNKGSVQEYENLIMKIDSQILKANLIFLKQKMCLMALVEYIFNKNIHNKLITFEEVASVTCVLSNEVELLVLKAFSLKLLGGKIDQVSQTIRFDWVQPRYLDTYQLKNMQNKLSQWCSKIEAMCNFLEGAKSTQEMA